MPCVISFLRYIICTVYSSTDQSVLENHYLTDKHFGSFECLDEEQVQQLINDTPTKTCNLEPLPTALVKEQSEALSPYITRIINTSFQEAEFPDKLKKSNVCPLIKSIKLQTILKSFQPVSNLTYISTLIERAACPQIMKFATISGNMESYQSVYRPQHSMETALLKVKTDILKAMDSREICCLLLLNLSAAFDTISHELLLNRLKYRFGFEDKVLTWIENYLSNREQRVIVQDGCSLQGMSQYTKLHQGLPQGSVLGPILFSLFISPIGDICCKHSILYHGYADDTQNYLSFKPAIPGDNHRCRKQLEKCIAEIPIWMHTNFLKLNDEKTEYIIIGTYKNLQYVADTDITIGDETITATDFVRDLSFWFDKELKGTVHINKTTSICIYTIRNVT